MSSSKRRGVAACIAAAALVTTGLAISTASANVPPSTFGGGDGNIQPNDANGLTDWLSPPPNFSSVLDLPSGQTDNSFTDGSKEDDTNVTVAAGSIPNNKADLRRQLVGAEVIGGELFMYLGATRANISGTVNYDFEINQAAQPNMTTPGPKVLNRTVGDLLITYDFAGGANKPTMSVRKWLAAGVWGLPTAATAANSEAEVNRVIINGAGLGDGNYAALTFAEASLNLTKLLNIPAGTCVNFASASTHSRASNSFNATMKDFIAPAPISVNNCGKIVIKKVTVPDPDVSATAFPFTLTGGPSALNKSFSLKNGETDTTSDVKIGSGYNAAETAPAGWTLTKTECSDGSPVNNIDVGSGETVTCTFTNTAKAALHIKKVAERDGVKFDFTSGTLDPNAFSLANGEVQDYPSLLPGGYDAAETVPDGWNLKSATCDNTNLPSAITLAPADDVTCTFTNVVERGSLLIHKARKHAVAGPGSHPQEGVTFTVTNAKNGTSEIVETNSSGDACVADLPVSFLDGDYTVTETVPAGYHGEAAKAYTVLADTDCDSAAPVNFLNTPLTNVTVSVDSQVVGGTASKMSCTDGTTVTDGATDADGDGSITVKDLEPTAPGVTLTCTIVVDP